VTEQDRAHFEALYRQHVRSVLRYALARTDREQAKDVTAEVFLVAWRRLADVPSDPVPWLLGVARNVIATQTRSTARRKALGVRLALVRDRQSRASDVAEQIAEGDAVRTAFARLRENDREVLRLIAWDGLSSDHAAEVLGVSRIAFAVRLHRARRKFATELAAADLPSETGSSTPLGVVPKIRPDAPNAIPPVRTKEAR
jgi:RNA polymerase sigma-70 factor, ECF subfamily